MKTIITKFITAKIILMFLVTICNFHSTFPQDKNSKEVNLKVEKLTLFKNGLGFVVSNTKLPDDAKRIDIGQLPIPSFGTYWVSYPKDVKLQSLVTSMEEIEKEVPAQSIAQMLLLNAGRKVTIHTADRDIEGIILANNFEKGSQLQSDPYFMSPRQPVDPYGQYLPTPIIESRILYLKTEKGTIVIDPVTITRAEFTGNEPINIDKIKQKCPTIRMELEQPAGGENVKVSYLAHGITWTPGYLIDLSDPKTAKFSAHAVIINEMTDFNNVEMQLVTGFPNIKFGDVLNPVAKSQTLAQFLASLSGSNRNSGSQYMMTQQAMVSNTRIAGWMDEAEQNSLVPEYSTASEGVAAEDLFFYPVNKFTLKKNETAWVPLFSAEMPYKHIYTWKIKDFVDQNDNYRANSESQGDKAAEEIWHSCRLVNTLKMPLTTAATEFITDEKFTGQDVCYYTPPNSETTIRINKAMNVIADQAEIEVERKRDAARFHGYSYDLVKVKGELKIKNKLDKAINLEISKELSGEVLESIPKSKDVKSANGLKQVNAKHMLTWDINLDSGKEEKISYQYQVYIRD